MSSQGFDDSLVTLWEPTNVFISNSGICFALIILNGEQSCSCTRGTVKVLWPSAALRIATDGAGNLLHQMHSDGFPLIPDIVCGDFDSITPDTVNFLRRKGAKIVKIEDQDKTDFTKCTELTMYTADARGIQLDMIIALGGICGRVDHIFGCMQTLFLHQQQSSGVPLYLWHKDSVVFLLDRGNHKIRLHQKDLTGICGLVPIGSPAKQVRTNGLRWNLNGDELAFGGTVSTSNQLAANTVDIFIGSDRLLFTMQLKIADLEKL